VHRPGVYSLPELDYLRGTEEFIDEKGDIKSRPLKQHLEHKLKMVPRLVAQAMGREYISPRNNSAAHKKLRETIAWRDAIVHPRWDRHVNRIGWFEAARAVDAIEMFLDSINLQLHPYVGFYFHILHTVPEGGDKDEDPGVAYRTRGRRDPKRQFVPMSEIGLRRLIGDERLETKYCVKFALGSECEGDSKGSMLTRSALIMLYALIDAQLAAWAQTCLHQHGKAFQPIEALFLTEFAVGVDADGDVTIAESHQRFKQRIVGVPRILARRVFQKDITIQLGNKDGESLLAYKDFRDRVMHPPLGKDPCEICRCPTPGLNSRSNSAAAPERATGSAMPDPDCQCPTPA
jgi:hypothetical protein